MKYPLPYTTHNEPVMLGNTVYFYSVRWTDLLSAVEKSGEFNQKELDNWDVRLADALLERMGYAVESSFADQEDMGEKDEQEGEDSGWVIYWK